MAAFLGELSGARQANSLGRTGDEGELAAQIEIHAASVAHPSSRPQRAARSGGTYLVSHREEQVLGYAAFQAASFGMTIM